MKKNVAKMFVVMILVVIGSLGLMAEIGHTQIVKEREEKEILIALLDYYEIPGWPEFEKNDYDCWVLTYEDRTICIPSYVLYTEEVQEIWNEHLLYTAR